MPSKVARPPSYDTPHVGYGKPVTLGHKERDELRGTLKRPQSADFIKSYELILGNYIAHRETVAQSTPFEVRKRLFVFLKNARALENSVSKFEGADKMLLDRFATQRFERNERYSGLNTLLNAIANLLPTVEDAITVVSKGEHRGRPQAYAEQALAVELRWLLQKETGRPPTDRKGDMFDNLLLHAFAHASRLNAFIKRRNTKPRKDVVALLRFALRAPPQPSPEDFRNAIEQEALQETSHWKN